MLQVPNISRVEYTLVDVNEEGFVSIWLQQQCSAPVLQQQ